MLGGRHCITNYDRGRMESSIVAVAVGVRVTGKKDTGGHQ